MDDRLSNVVERERAYWIERYRDREQGSLDDWSERTKRRLSKMFGDEKKLSFFSKIKIAKQPIRILDAGCGSGTFLLACSRLIPGTCEVFGVDLRLEALSIARTKADIKGKHPVRLIRASVNDLPWPDGFFDIVHAEDLLEHLPDARKAISELLRVTKENGYFFTHVPDYRMGYEPHIKKYFQPPTSDGLEALKRKLKEEMGITEFVKKIFYIHPLVVEEIIRGEYPFAEITRIFKRTKPFWKRIFFRIKGYKYDILARKKSGKKPWTSQRA